MCIRDRFMIHSGFFGSMRRRYLVASGLMSLKRWFLIYISFSSGYGSQQNVVSAPFSTASVEMCIRDRCLLAFTLCCVFYFKSYIIRSREYVGLYFTNLNESPNNVFWTSVQLNTLQFGVHEEMLRFNDNHIGKSNLFLE